MISQNNKIFLDSSIKKIKTISISNEKSFDKEVNRYLKKGYKIKEINSIEETEDYCHYFNAIMIKKKKPKAI